MAAFEVLLLVFGIVLLLYCFYALTSGRLRIKRPRKWKENLKEFKREKLPFIYYFYDTGMFSYRNHFNNDRTNIGRFEYEQ